jgi:hypothetical protein
MCRFNLSPPGVAGGEGVHYQNIYICGMPVLLYGCVNWILMDGFMERFEKLQAELAKWPKHFHFPQHSSSYSFKVSNSEMSGIGEKAGIPIKSD